MSANAVVVNSERVGPYRQLVSESHEELVATKALAKLGMAEAKAEFAG
jgi:hypothetical protein